MAACVAIGWLVAALCLFADIRTAVSAVVEEEIFLNVTIEGRRHSLDAMIVKPAGAQGRLPVALITHGQHFDEAENKKIRARQRIGQARDFAHRGWLAVVVIRPGFGRSSGSFVPGPDCERQDFARTLERIALTLAAAIETIGRRPDADISRVVAVGASVGGAAALALGARYPKGLVAAVNLSGGIKPRTRSKSCEPGPNFAAAMRRFGARSKIPTLWLYSENDSYFPPSLARALHAAYTETGGTAELRVLPPFGTDGHQFWGMFEGRRAALPLLDQFLRAHNLPTWDPARLTAALAADNLSDTARADLERYFTSGPSEKAFAVSETGRTSRWWGGGELADMREKSLASCQERAKIPCRILLENFDLVGSKLPQSAR